MNQDMTHGLKGMLPELSFEPQVQPFSSHWTSQHSYHGPTWTSWSSPPHIPQVTIKIKSSCIDIITNHCIENE